MTKPCVECQHVRFINRASSDAYLCYRRKVMNHITGVLEVDPLLCYFERDVAPPQYDSCGPKGKYFKKGTLSARDDGTVKKEK